MTTKQFLWRWLKLACCGFALSVPFHGAQAQVVNSPLCAQAPEGVERFIVRDAVSGEGFDTQKPGSEGLSLNGFIDGDPDSEVQFSFVEGTAYFDQLNENSVNLAGQVKITSIGGEPVEDGAVWEFNGIYSKTDNPGAGPRFDQTPFLNPETNELENPQALSAQSWKYYNIFSATLTQGLTSYTITQDPPVGNTIYPLQVGDTASGRNYGLGASQYIYYEKDNQPLPGDLTVNLDYCFKDETPANNNCLDSQDTVDNDLDGLANCADPDCAPITGCEPCTNFADDDNDGITDSCLDPDECPAEHPRCNPESSCNDGVDNDFDFNTDCGDADCSGRDGCPVVGPAEQCDDVGAVDEDNDGQANCADLDCCGDPACAETPNPACNPPPAETCDNNLDDDGDGVIDCADADCVADPACVVPAETCNNGLDDDGDGNTDCADDDCAAAPSCTLAETCDNNADDDGDNLIDCNDVDCAGSPACVVTPEACNKNADDDGDSLIDCDDDDCSADTACIFPAESCANGIDDDLDGLTDCQDANCIGDEACIVASENCGNGLDDDGNGSTDCSDNACSSLESCHTPDDSANPVLTGGAGNGDGGCSLASSIQPANMAPFFLTLFPLGIVLSSRLLRREA